MKIPSALLACGIAGLPPVNAAPDFFEDFQKYAPGVLPESRSSGSPWLERTTQTNDNGIDLFTRVERDSSNIFQAGPENKYLRLTDENTVAEVNHNVGVDGFRVGPRGQASFVFYDPSTVRKSGHGWLFRIGNNLGNANTAFGVFLEHGAIYAAVGDGLNPAPTPLGVYELDRPHSITLVFNNSGVSVEYAAGMVLAANTMDVWLDGRLIAKGVAKAGGAAGQGIESGVAIDSFSFTQKKGFLGMLCIDDISLTGTFMIGIGRANAAGKR